MKPVDRVTDRVAAAVRGPAEIPHGSQVIVAVSGGPDSVCLLHVMRTLAPRFSWSLHVAHVNHCLRGAEADADEAFVRAQCARWSLPFYARRVDVAALAAAARESVETTARRERYRYFEALAARMEAARCAESDRQPEGAAPVVIAVAHHREDQAETVLLHLFRGSGLRGLAGMPPRNGRVVRPLLAVPRQDILDYLEAVGEAWRADASNETRGFTRNRVRLDLIPRIERATAPGLTARLAATADLVREDVWYLEREAREHLAALRQDAGVDAAGLRRLPWALSSRVVRFLYAEGVGHDQNLQRKHITAVLALLATPRRARRVSTDLPGGMRAVCADGVLRIGPRRPDPGAPPVWEPVRLLWAGQTQTPAGRFVATGSDVQTSPADGEPPLVAALLRPEFGQAEVRTRRPGDRIRPLGGAGSRSLKRFFIDRRIPAHVRDQLPLVVVGTEVAWIPGIAFSATYQATEPGRAAPADPQGQAPLVWLAYHPTDEAAAAIRVAVQRKM